MSLLSTFYIARVSVHFQSVVDKFLPHDAVFSFSTPAELRETTLSSALSLHAAPASIRSSGSSIQQRHSLAEIVEDAGEGYTSPNKDADPGPSREHPVITRAHKESVNSINTPASDSVRHKAPNSPLPLSPRDLDKSLPATPIDSIDEGDRPRLSSSLSANEQRPALDSRQSSQSARPSTIEVHSAYEFKPKIRLGPRPSVETRGLSRSSGPSLITNGTRPVSTLPSGVRVPTRSRSPEKQNTQEIENTCHIAERWRVSTPSPTPAPSIRLSERPASIRSGLSTDRQVGGKSTAMTPEKRRLMKALQIRQKQIAARNHVDESSPKLDGVNLMSPKIDNVTLDSKETRSENVHLLRDPCKHSEAFKSKTLDSHVPSRIALKESPISNPGTSEGRSTQASSIIDDDDVLKESLKEITSDHESTISHRDDMTVDRLDKPNPPTSLQALDGEVSHGAEDTTSRVMLGQVKRISQPLLDQKSPSLKVGSQEPHDPSRTYLESTHSTTRVEPPSVAGDLYHELSYLESDAEKHFTNTSFRPRSTFAGIEAQELSPGDSVSQQASPRQSWAPTVSGILHDNKHHNGSQLQLDENLNLAMNLQPSDIPLPPTTDDEDSMLNRDQSISEEEGTIRPISVLEPKPEAVAEDTPRRVFTNGDHLVSTRPSTADTLDFKKLERQTRRRGLVDPIRIVSSAENSDDAFLSDESFMEELQSATLQEARPVLVQTPSTPIFSKNLFERRPSDSISPQRHVSSPVGPTGRSDQQHISSESTAFPSPRSFSASVARDVEQQQMPSLIVKKIGMSSGISQRIKALELLSTREPTPMVQSPPSISPPGTSSGFAKYRQPSVHTPPPTLSPGIVDGDRSRKSPRTPKISFSPDDNHAHGRGTSINIDYSSSSKPGKSRPESISVTARIIRDVDLPKSPSPFEMRTVELHRSPLIVEHQPAETAPPQQLNKPPMYHFSVPPSIVMSSPTKRDRPPPPGRRDSSTSKRSLPSRNGSDANMAPSISDTSSVDLSKDGRRESKKTRLFKRMSSIASSHRRKGSHARSDSWKEERIIERQESIPEVPPAIVDIGDVNIQFPDTLVRILHCDCIDPLTLIQLWKRRHMQIDDHGNLILSRSKADSVLMPVLSIARPLMN